MGDDLPILQHAEKRPPTQDYLIEGEEHLYSCYIHKAKRIRVNLGFVPGLNISSLTSPQTQSVQPEFCKLGILMFADRKTMGTIRLGYFLYFLESSASVYVCT